MPVGYRVFDNSRGYGLEGSTWELLLLLFFDSVDVGVSGSVGVGASVRAHLPLSAKPAILSRGLLAIAPEMDNACWSSRYSLLRPKPGCPFKVKSPCHLYTVYTAFGDCHI